MFRYHKEIEKIIAQDRTTTTTHSDFNGLSLRVSPKKKAVWQIRYRYAGKAHRLDLGTFPYMSLSEAREACFECHKQLDKGENPSTVLKQSKIKSSDTNQSIESLG